MKVYIEVVLWALATVVVFGIAGPGFISSESTEGVAAGVALVIVFIGAAVERYLKYTEASNEDVK